MAWLDLEEDIAEEMGDLRLDRVRSEHGLSTSRKTAWFSDELISEVKRQNSLADRRSREERSAAARAGNAVRSPELRAEIARNAGVAGRKKQLAGHEQTDRMTPERRSELARNAARIGNAMRSAEQRSELARNAGIAGRKKQLATMTPEQRSEIARRSAATRKARRAA